MNDDQFDRMITGNYGQDQYSDECECSKCGETVDATFETSKPNYNLCKTCIEDYQTCGCCGTAIVESDYDHDDLCDNCVDSKADKLLDAMKGETY